MFSALLLMLAQSPVTIPELMLACDGSSMVGGWPISRERYQRQMRVQLHIIRGNADIFIPMLGDQEAGWLPVKDLYVTEAQITGTVKTSAFTTSKFRIDRTTGIMTTEGGFTGTCTKVDPEQHAF